MTKMRFTSPVVAIMQPYFLPYPGYFELIYSSDLFVIYDDVQFTKRGWINRNKILRHGKAETFTVNIRNVKEKDLIRNVEISQEFAREKLIAKLSEAYGKSKYFYEASDLLFPLIRFQTNSLFEYIFHSIKTICDALGIETKLIRSSNVGDFTNQKSEKKVIAICSTLNAKTYINPESGMFQYSQDAFGKFGINLQSFLPNSSILLKGTERLSIAHNFFHLGIEKTTKLITQSIL